MPEKSYTITVEEPIAGSREALDRIAHLVQDDEEAFPPILALGKLTHHAISRMDEEISSLHEGHSVRLVIGLDDDGEEEGLSDEEILAAVDLVKAKAQRAGGDFVLSVTVFEPPAEDDEDDELDLDDLLEDEDDEDDDEDDDDDDLDSDEEDDDPDADEDDDEDDEVVERVALVTVRRDSVPRRRRSRAA